MVPKEHPYDPVMDRSVFSLSVASFEQVPLALDLASGNFACLLVCDATELTEQRLCDFLEKLLRAGASYFVCWGPDCEFVHDMADQVAYSKQSELGIPEDSCIMTTWHASDPLEEALWFFLALSWPDDFYASSTRSALAISVGSQSWELEIESALADPRRFVQTYLEGEL